MRCDYCESTIPENAAYCPHCGEAVPGAPAYDGYRYEAFISYRHLDHDPEVALRLQHRIEGFRIPKGIRKENERKRLGKVFRDEDGLPTDPSLPNQILSALEHAPYLIVVCSPHTNESLW